MHQRHVIDRYSLLYMPATAEVETEWFSTDEDWKYEQNKDILDPIYQDLQIVYKFNSLGYRTGELEEYETKKFFIAMGCSYTVGEGLAVQHRWSDQLTELTGLKNMNLGISGSGLDTHLINTLHYVNSKMPRPRFVVIQHPEVCREQKWFSVEPDCSDHYSEIDPDSSLDRMAQLHNEMTRELSPMAQDQDAREITAPVNAGYYTDIIDHLWGSIGVPVYHWCFSGDADVSKRYMDARLHSIPNDFPELHDTWPGDVARDNAHDGIGNNKAVAEILHKHFIGKLL